MSGDNKRSYVLKQTCSFKLLIYLNTCDLLLSYVIKGIEGLNELKIKMRAFALVSLWNLIYYVRFNFPHLFGTLYALFNIGKFLDVFESSCSEVLYRVNLKCFMKFARKHQRWSCWPRASTSIKKESNLSLLFSSEFRKI